MARQMSTPVIPFRPIGLSEVFSSSFEIYRRRPGTFVVLALLPVIFIVVVSTTMLVLGIIALIPLINSFDPYSILTPPDPSLLIGFLAGSFVGILLCCATSIWSILLLSVATVQVDRGGTPTVGSVMRDARGSFARSAGATGLFMAVGIVVYAIFGAIVALSIHLEEAWPMAIMVLVMMALIPLQFVFIARFGLVAQVMAVESLGAVSALRRSWQITRGQGLRVLGYILALNLVVAAASSAIQMVTNMVTSISSNLTTIPQSQLENGDPAAIMTMFMPLFGIFGLAMLINIAFQVIVLPYQTIFTTTLYTDVRRRHEGMSGTPSF